MNESIYLVWSPTGKTMPTHRHPDVTSARKEARRLCEINKGQEFFVLRAIESVTYRTDPYVCVNYCKS